MRRTIMSLAVLCSVSLPLSGYLEPIEEGGPGWDKAPWWYSLPPKNILIHPQMPCVGQTVHIAVKDSIARAGFYIVLSEEDDPSKNVVIRRGKTDAVGDFSAAFEVKQTIRDTAGRALEIVPGRHYRLGIYINANRMRIWRQLGISRECPTPKPSFNWKAWQ